MFNENNQRPKILFVDDSKTARKTALKILSDKYDVYEAVDGKDAWSQLEQNPDFALVFADLQMPKVNGLQLLQRIRTSPDRRIAQKPVIMITGHSDSLAAMRAVYEMGATGFVSKPFSDIDLMSCSYSYISLNQSLNKMEENLGIDRQSGLYNASRFEEEGARFLSLALRHKLELSIVYIEIKSLSEISSNHSNKVAKQVIVEVAKRIQIKLREEEFIARVGPSTFALMLPMTGSFKARIAVLRIQSMVRNMEFVYKKNKIRVDIAVGISSVGLSSKKVDFKQLCLRANTALQTNNSSANDGVTSYYDESDQEHNAIREVQNDDVLSESLLHIIDGNFQNVQDGNIAYVTSVLKPFIKYAEVKTGVS